MLIITFATSKSDPEDKPEPEAKNIPLEIYWIDKPEGQFIQLPYYISETYSGNELVNCYDDAEA